MAKLPKILDKNILLMALKLNSLTEPANVTVHSFAAGLVIPLIHESFPSVWRYSVACSKKIVPL